MVNSTRTIRFIRQGAKGERGASLRGPQDWDSLPSDYQFFAGKDTEVYKDVVVYNHNYYSCIKSHTKNAATPGIDGNYWSLASAIEMVATKVFFSEHAIIDNLTVTSLVTSSDRGRIEIRNGEIKFYSNGNTFPTMRLGISEQDGKPCMAFYDESGNFLYDLSPRGINEVSHRESGTQNVGLIRIGNIAEDASTVVIENAARNKLSTAAATYYRYLSGYVEDVWVDRENDGRIYRIADIVGADSNHQAIRDNSINYLPDGWYLPGTSSGATPASLDIVPDVDSLSPEGGSKTYYNIYYYKNGRVSRTMLMTVSHHTVNQL